MKQILAICLLLVWAATAQAEAPHLRLAYADTEIFPYQLGNGLDIPSAPGIAVEIVRLGLADAGLRLDLVRLPNRRVLDSLKTGEIDGAFLFSYNDDRGLYAAYPMKDGAIDQSRRLSRQTYVLYKRADNPLKFDGRQVDNLRLSIAANAGFSIAADLKLRGLPVLEVETTSLAMGMLEAGRVDGYATVDSTGDLYLRTAGLTDIVKFPTPIASKDYFLIFGRAFAAANRPLAERIWDRLAATRAAQQSALERKYEGTPPS